MSKSPIINHVGDIDGVAAIEEWLGFRKYMFEKRKPEKERFQIKLMNCKRHFVLQKLLLMHTSYIQQA